jgi:hypothetical protein
MTRATIELYHVRSNHPPLSSGSSSHPSEPLREISLAPLRWVAKSANAALVSQSSAQHMVLVHPIAHPFTQIRLDQHGPQGHRCNEKADDHGVIARRHLRCKP